MKKEKFLYRKYLVDTTRVKDGFYQRYEIFCDFLNSMFLTSSNDPLNNLRNYVITNYGIDFKFIDDVVITEDKKCFTVSLYGYNEGDDIDLRIKDENLQYLLSFYAYNKYEEYIIKKDGLSSKRIFWTEILPTQALSRCITYDEHFLVFLYGNTNYFDISFEIIAKENKEVFRIFDKMFVEEPIYLRKVKTPDELLYVKEKILKSLYQRIGKEVLEKVRINISTTNYSVASEDFKQKERLLSILANATVMQVI